MQLINLRHASSVMSHDFIHATSDTASVNSPLRCHLSCSRPLPGACVSPLSPVSVNEKGHRSLPVHCWRALGLQCPSPRHRSLTDRAASASPNADGCEMTTADPESAPELRPYRLGLQQQTRLPIRIPPPPSLASTTTPMEFERD